MATPPPVYSNYLLDWKNVFYNLLPHFLRKAVTLDYIYSVSRPLFLLNFTFNSFRTNTLYRLDFTGQTIYLTHYLNDQHDPLNRAIYITNNNTNPYNYLFNVGENYPDQYVYNTAEGNPWYLQNYAEVLAGNDFTIFVPATLVYNEIDFNENVGYYAMAGVSWNIQTY